MPKDKALIIIKANGGKDITPGLAVVGPKGEHPLHGFYWQLKDYKAVIEVSGAERVERLTYWTEKDFGESKDHREKSARNITAFKIDRSNNQLVLE